MTTKMITVQLANDDTWDDVIGRDTSNPKYKLCCGTIVVVGGSEQSNKVRNNAKMNGRSPGCCEEAFQLITWAVHNKEKKIVSFK